MYVMAQHSSLKTAPSCSTSSLDSTSRTDPVALGLYDVRVWEQLVVLNLVMRRALTREPVTS